MSSSKALQSLTACYTDSENEDVDDKEETAMEIDSDSESKEAEEIDNDLPPEPSGKCSPEMEEKIKNFFSKINAGVDLNKKLQCNKAFRNPSIYEKLIEFCDVNELGTNYPPSIYDPFRWGKESFYDELAKVQKAEMDKREKEKKEKTKVEIVSGTAKKTNPSNGHSNVSTSADGEKRRKTKWDQVESSSSIRTRRYGRQVAMMVRKLEKENSRNSIVVVLEYNRTTLRAFRNIRSIPRHYSHNWKTSRKSPNCKKPPRNLYYSSLLSGKLNIEIVCWNYIRKLL